MTRSFIVTSPLWPEPIEVTIESGLLDTMYALYSATRATVWEKADYQQKMADLAAGRFPPDKAMMDLWQHPVTFEQAVINRHIRESSK